MKTIRSNCFETNSSSTHSITIQLKSKVNEELLHNGILQPQNLKSTQSYHDRGDDGYHLCASTPDEKASLFVHHLLSVKEYNDYDEQKVESLFNFAIQQLISRLHYTNINTSVMQEFCAYDDDDEKTTYIDKIFQSANPESEIIDHITNVIMNEDIQIIESEKEY